MLPAQCSLETRAKHILNTKLGKALFSTESIKATFSMESDPSVNPWEWEWEQKGDCSVNSGNCYEVEAFVWCKK
jgi:hypothetical protein